MQAPKLKWKHSFRLGERQQETYSSGNGQASTCAVASRVSSNVDGHLTRLLQNHHQQHRHINFCFTTQENLQKAHPHVRNVLEYTF